LLREQEVKNFDVNVSAAPIGVGATLRTIVWGGVFGDSASLVGLTMTCKPRS